MYIKRTDEQLVLSFLTGNDESFEELVHRYLKPIYNFLFRFTQDRDSLDDLTQETFVKAWKNLQKFDQEKSFRTWLYAIAKNTAYDFLKKKKALPFSFFDLEDGSNRLENIENEDEMPDEIFDKNLSAKNLEEKLQKISENYRLILLMKYKDDFSLQEISEILKLPYNTVKSQHTRALAALKKVLSKPKIIKNYHQLLTK